MSAGFRWTVDSQPRVLVLNKPMAFEPAPAHRKKRWAVDSLSLSAREVISVASGRMEVEATIRFEKNAQGLVDMLRDAADGNVVTYYPDLSNGTGYALWLIGNGDEVALSPQAGNWSLGNYEVRTRWRDASASGTSIAALFERLLFRLDAGHFPLGYSFTRSGTVGPYIDSDGVLKSAAEDIARIEWVDLDGDGTRQTPVIWNERSTVNLCLQSEDLGTTWVTVGTPTRSAAAHTSSGVTLDLIGDDAAGASEYYEQTVSLGTDGNKAVSVFAKQGTSPNANGNVVMLRDVTAGAYRLRATITWSSGVPSVAMSEGVNVGDPELLRDGVYRFRFRATGCVAANNNRVRLYPTTETAGETGNVYVGGVQVEDKFVPSTYVQTTTGTGTRNDETTYFAWPHVPQEMTGYLRFREDGTVLTTDLRLFHIGAATGSNDPRMDCYVSAGGFYSVQHDNGSTIPFASLATAPSHGDVVEIRVVLRADGSVMIGQSIGGASETTATTSTTAALGTAWADSRLYLGSRGTGNRGLNPFASVKFAPGTKTMAEMRAL